MSFDLSNVLKQAEEVVNSEESGFDGPRLLYPGFGDLKVRILYNPKSQSVMRLVKRHKVNNKQHICAETYHQDCPLCTGVETYKTLTGSDMWTMDQKRIGLVFAQYVGVSNDYDNGDYPLPEKGEIVVVMLPWTAYKQMSELIQRAGENANKILTDNEGMVITISKKKGNIVEYNCMIDPFSKTYKSCDNQEEFDELLMDLPDLNEVLCPSTMPDDLLTKLQLESDKLLAKVNGAIAQDNGVSQAPAPQPASVPPQAQQQFMNPPTQQASESKSTPTPASQPEPQGQLNCDGLGHFNSKSRDCLMCDQAVDCAKQTKKNAK